VPYKLDHSRVHFIILITRKGKDRPRIGHEGPEGENGHSSTVPLTSVLDGGGLSTLLPGHFNPGKETRYPLYRRVGWASGPVWGGGAENLAPIRIEFVIIGVLRNHVQAVR
jgi:hypothetical protein